MAHEWLDDACFYEIYPQSFCDSNSDGIGDLRGIIRKLDYILDVGCNAIWLNPVFDSPFVDAGYDVRDYYRIAPRYGTNEDMKRLFREAHRRDMHVLLDLVPGHTSEEPCSVPCPPSDTQVSSSWVRGYDHACST